MAKKSSTKATREKKKRAQLRIKTETLSKLKAEYEKALRERIHERTVGRPTKYQGEKTCELMEAIIETMGPRNFFSYCSVDHVAETLGVHRDTIYEWNDKHPEFAAALNHWEQKRNTLFYPFTKALRPAIWIFLAKNWLGLKDEQISKIFGEGTIVQYISHIPDPRSGQQKPGPGKKRRGGKGRRSVEKIDGIEK